MYKEILQGKKSNICVTSYFLLFLGEVGSNARALGESSYG